MAVLDSGDNLVSYAWATPPPWVKTAGMAEAWAVLLTLRCNAAPPTIITDCLGVLIMAQAGALKALSPKNPAARIWREIIDISGGDLRHLRKCLVWMPSHESADGVADKRTSRERAVTIPEWRANQLADKLANRGAGVSDLHNASDRVIKEAGKALCHHGAQLGMVTRAANKHRVDFTDKHGKPGHKYLRDSTTVEWKTKQQSKVPAAAAAAASVAAVPAAVAAAPPPPEPPAPVCHDRMDTTCYGGMSFRQDKAHERKSHARIRAESAKQCTATLVQESSSTTSDPVESASSRMTALRLRIRSEAHASSP